VIPQGAYLHLNAWAIQHDPARHENPDDFVPERYANDPTTVSFMYISGQSNEVLTKTAVDHRHSKASTPKM